MKTHFNISLSRPCSKQFNALQATENGAYCKACKKDVIDFRQMSHTEALAYIQHAKTPICGVFKPVQLQQTMAHTTVKQTRTTLLRVAAIAVFSLLSLHTVQAQEKIINTAQNQVTQNKLLKGLIADESGPLPGASILLKNTKIGVTADFDGKFTFPKALKEGDVLLVSYIGYKTQTIVIKKAQQFLNVTLTGEDIDLLGEVEVNQVYSSKKQ